MFAFSCTFLLLFAISDGFSFFTGRLRVRNPTSAPLQAMQTTRAAIDGASSEYSPGLQCLIDYLNSNPRSEFMKALAMTDKKLFDEASWENMWSNGNFVVDGCTCAGVVEAGLELHVDCKVKEKKSPRNVFVTFPRPVRDEIDLKRVLVEMAYKLECTNETAKLSLLPFGENFSLPEELRFNDVPHARWMRSYFYEAAAAALAKAITDSSIPDKSRLQIKLNFPELNPAFDTYRIGTMLELVRDMALSQAYEGKRVRLCVQQPLGEGIFVGLPLALASMRIVMEKMDWGVRPSTSADGSENTGTKSAALIRFGSIGADECADDDDVFIIIAPQNVVGASIMDSLDAMVKQANGRPLVLVNPLLSDRPSSNNVMQIRGRAERRALADSFQDIYGNSESVPHSINCDDLTCMYVFPLLTHVLLFIISF